MRGFWNREQGLERELRASRPAPREEFVEELANRVVTTPRRPTAARRVAIAAVLTGAMLASLAGFGGIGYAGQPAKRAVATVKKVFVPKGVVVRKAPRSSAAADQYRGPTRPKVKKKKAAARVVAKGRPRFTG